MTRVTFYKKWTPEEDEILVETVLSYIASNKSQQQAFQDVASVLDDRTPEACAFRWNATLRKQYKLEIEKAKQKRAEIRYRRKFEKEEEEKKVKTVDMIDQDNTQNSTSKEPLIVKSAREIYENLVTTLDEILKMHELKDKMIENLRMENDKLRVENERLKKENEELIASQEQFAKAFEIARRVILGEEQEIIGHKFLMERNGNLNKI